MKQRLVLFIDAHRAVAEEGVIFRRNVEVGHRLITADIHSPHDNAAPGGRLQRLAENVVEFVFRWRAGPVHIEHLRAEQANRLRAVVEGRHRLYRMGDVRRDLDADTVFRLPRLIQPYLLLLLDLRLNPRLLLIVARHRRTQVDHQQPGVAVDLHLSILPRQQCVEVNPHQGRDIE